MGFPEIDKLVFPNAKGKWVRAVGVTITSLHATFWLDQRGGYLCKKIIASISCRLPVASQATLN